MVEVAQTRELFSALINRPALEDRLLQRPPFKFIHDIVVETIRATGYLSNLFDQDELDSRKAGLTRESKIAFIQKLIDALNVEGDLDDVSPAKLVAGKEADRTNLLLQKLAIQAAAQNIDRPTKQSRDKKRHRSSSHATSNPQKSETPQSREKQRQDKKKEVEREKRRLSRALHNQTDTSPMNIDSNGTATKKTKKSSGEDGKSRDKSKKRSSEENGKSRDKSKKRSSDEKKEKVKKTKSRVEEPDHFVDEGIGSATPHLSQRRDIASPIPRESSGGTSKAEDSGIADELHESERQSSATLRNYQAESSAATPDKLPPTAPNDASKAPSRLSNVASPSIGMDGDKLIANDQDDFRRPTTAAGRPLTSMGRPGTAAARPAPPKVKKTKIGDIDPTTITPQPATFEKSAVIVDDATSDAKSQTNENDFVLDEEEEPMNDLMVSNANVAAELDTNDHGALISKIVANTQQIQKDATALPDDIVGLDATESKKLRADVDACRNSLQAVAQTVQPLSRTLEFVTEDLDVLLREIDDSRKRRAQAQRQLAERVRRDDANAALLAQLKQMDAELVQVRGQIAKKTAAIIENERRINELMALN